MIDYYMSQWEYDLEQLLRRWSLSTVSLEKLMSEIDLVLQKREQPVSPDSPLGLRLTVAVSFLWHRKDDPRVAEYLVVGSQNSIIKPELSRALFRVIMPIPLDRLGDYIDTERVVGLIAEDRIGNRHLKFKEGIEGA
ncbi:MAG: hypothetical protein QM715_01310 [Nibricoccus sp.]